MKIKITTIREFPSSEFYEWIQAANAASGNDPRRHINGQDLMEKRKVVFITTDRMGPFSLSITTAETTYEILED